MGRPRKDRRFPGLRRLCLFGAFTVAAFCVWAYVGPLPNEVEASASKATTLVLLDRRSRPLDPTSSRVARDARRAASEDGRVPSLAARGSKLARATIVAEDERFTSHPGVDPFAIGRAGLADIRARSMVQGGSTLTQQLVKLRMGRTGRSGGFGAKAREALYAVRLDRKLSKEQILSAFLDEAPYGGRVVGAEDGARVYFDTTVSQLSWAQAAYLAALPQRPTRFNPLRDPNAALDRQRWILRRLRSSGAIDTPTYEKARRELISVSIREPGASPAPHVVDMLRSDPKWATPVDHANAFAFMRTSLDLDLQRKVQGIARRRRALLASNSVSNVSVVILDNRTGAVRAWEGSGGYTDIDNGGMINGPLQRRQTGSTIKPFIYGVAFDAGRAPGDMIDDAPFVRPGFADDFRPENYDRRFRGPVSLRMALASSINVPAVKLLAEVGPQALLDSLTAGGVEIDGGVERHGLSLALGAGEMNLLDLTRSYAAIARGGRSVEATLSESASRAASDEPSTDDADLGDLGDPMEDDTQFTQGRIMSAGAAFLVADVLSDNEARTPAFGRNSVLRFPFPVAAKTGTSQNYHDNWVVGFTKDFTVGVWVGNFDRTSLRDASGITGAGPLFHDVMLAAHDSLTPKESVDRPELVMPQPETIEAYEVCASAACDATRTDYRWVARRSAATDQDRSGPGPRPTNPEIAFALTEPKRGAKYLIDPSIPVDRQALRFRATGGVAPYRFTIRAVDGPPGGQPVPDSRWTLEAGEFEVCASDALARRQCTRIVVR